MSIIKFYFKILITFLGIGGLTPTFCQEKGLSNFKSHIVIKGETPYSISKKYNISIETLQDLNPDFNKIIKIGQSIKVPINDEELTNTLKKSSSINIEKEEPYINNKTKKIKSSLFEKGLFYGFNNNSEFQLSFPPGVYSDKEKIKIVITNNTILNYKVFTIDNNGAKQHFSDTILISKPTVLKINHIDSLGNEKCYVGSYIVGVRHEIPIVAIYVNQDQFFNENGIYSGYSKLDPVTKEILTIGNAWRKKPIPSFAQFYFYEKLIDELPLDIKTYGGMTLGWKEKSLQLSARKEKYGRGKIKVKLFESIPMDKFQHVVLRTSGNDQNKTRIKDMSISQVGDDISLNTKASRAVVLYINGRYWGIHNLREKVNKDYFKYRYGWKTSEFTEVQGSGRRNKKYKSVVNYSMKNYNDSSFIPEIYNRIDIDNFFNFHIFQTYISNPDCKGNIRFFKHQNSNWKWVIYDTDLGCGHNFINRNFIKDKTFPEKRYWYNPRFATDLLNSTLKNEQLKEKFIIQYCYLLSTYLNKQNFQVKFLKNRLNIENEIPLHFKRRNHLYKENIYSYNKRLKSILNYFEKRDKTIHNHLKKVFDLEELYKVSIDQNIETFNGITINQSSVSTNKINGYFFENYFPKVKIKATNHEYFFLKWNDGDKSPVRKINKYDTNLIAIFNRVDTSKLYEKIYLDKYYVKGDGENPLYFISLVNKSKYDVSLNNFKLYEDVNSKNFTIFNEILNPGEYIILTNNISQFRKKSKNDSVKILPIQIGNNYPYSVSFVLLDNNGSLVDKLQITIPDSNLVISNHYLFSKNNFNQLLSTDLKSKKLKNLSFDYFVANKYDIKSYYQIVVLILLLFFCFFAFLYFKNLI